MFVTTAGRTDQESIAKARHTASELKVPYIPRHKRSVAQLQKMYTGDCLVVGKDRLDLYKEMHKEPFFFHPNVAMLRIKRLLKGEEDPYVCAAGLHSGSTVLDCTLGLGSDAIVASIVTGEGGKVRGIEENPLLAYVVKRGFETYLSGIPLIDQALRRIEVLAGDSLDLLKSCDDKSFDVVYFDPMFEESIIESNGIRPLTNFAYTNELTEELFGHAKRVARKRVVMKDHFRSQRFERFNFQVNVRKTSKFHFGYIEI
ncbi:class I SAM-dependent methyltransferase [Bacillus sp. V5-8f]|uniref:class I SAM-dependent methyltransferase n=1 Tax=Bacillus sp. V5-8f TaxID=2053044 RepID=UPI000C75E430|nr:class I SAM-dependent methyltransferase [Bacillus sp. V5-8f]PLT34947.1 hypothetical protein CUU64_06020 [Bacillus sp. V5-8f]